MPDEIWIDEDASDDAFEKLKVYRLREAWERRRQGLDPVDDQASLPAYTGRPEPRVTVFISKRPGSVLVQRRFEPDDGIIGDVSAIVEPGGSVYGRPYEFWAALEPGEYRVAISGGPA
jgi:hypothetical protein